MIWKPSVSSGSFKSERWVRGLGFRPYMVRGTIGVARKFENGTERLERCGHVHHKRSLAATCAERLAKRLNREETHEDL